MAIFIIQNLGSGKSLEKAINFTIINHDKVPTVLAVKNYIDANCATLANFNAKAAELSRAVDASVLGTRLRKYTEVYKDETTGNDASRRRLMIQIVGAQHIADSWSSITSCTLNLMVCARRRGKGYHWFHPKNYDYEWSEGEGEKGAPYGYATIAGHATNRQLGTQQNPIIEEFPAVPEWMPHDGLMETEITLSLADVQRGYILLDLNTYFLPMIKPSFPNTVEDDNWGEVAFMGVAAFNTATPKAKPALVTWELAIDGEIVGTHHNELRIGMSRSESAVTTVAIDDNGDAALQNLYTSIS